MLPSLPFRKETLAIAVGKQLRVVIKIFFSCPVLLDLSILLQIFFTGLKPSKSKYGAKISCPLQQRQKFLLSGFGYLYLLSSKSVRSKKYIFFQFYHLPFHSLCNNYHPLPLTLFRMGIFGATHGWGWA